MDATEPTTSDVRDDQQVTTASTPDDLLADDLVEEISIDGMCGVY